MEGVSKSTVLTEEQVGTCLRLLAAANHRQWHLWGRSLVDPFNICDSDAAIERELDHRASRNAEGVVKLVGDVVGRELVLRDMAPLMEQKRAQLVLLSRLLRDTNAAAAADRERQLAVCRKPFIRLSAKAQTDAYRPATQDLYMVAELAGLIMPYYSVRVAYVTPGQALRRRLLHMLGRHEGMMSGEQNWSRTCLGCHRWVSYSY